MSEISITYFESLIRGTPYVARPDDQLRLYLGRLPLFQYRHTISADGGLESATIGGITPNEAQILDWFSDGVGRHIEVSDSAGCFFDGFVDSVEIQLGELVITRGPLSEICNKVRVQYSTITWETNPPVGGDPATTDWAIDADSQARYGILERTLSAGEMDETAALQLRDTYLERHKLPATTQTLRAGSDGQRTLAINVLGYRKWFELYFYSDRITTGTVTVTAKLLDIINADVNDVFSTDISHIQTNATDTGAPETENRDAWSIIKAMVALGDAANQRWLLTVRPGRVVYFAPAPQAFFQYEYIARKVAPHLAQLPATATNAENAASNVIPAWRVFPGMWVFARSFLPSLPIVVPLRDDPRIIFIEQVEYSYPNGLAISGGQVNTPREVLATNYGLASE